MTLKIGGPRFKAPPFFPDVDSRFKFCAFVASHSPVGDQAKCAFFLQDVSELNEPSRLFRLAANDFASINPNTGTAPIFRTRRDAELTTAVYERLPVLVNRSTGREVKTWPLKYVTMFHMTNDSGKFRTRQELEEREGAWPIGGNRFNSPAGEWLPLYEGKMVQAYDHRAAGIVVNPENQHRPAQPVPAALEQHQEPDWLPAPQFWVQAAECGWPAHQGWVLGFKEITAPTNIRTMIATLLPTVGFGNKVPIFKPAEGENDSWLLAANFNSTVFDFVVRQKVQGQTLNLFIVEQFPVVPKAGYRDVRFGPKSAAEVIREAVLELTYTAHPMAPSPPTSATWTTPVSPSRRSLGTRTAACTSRPSSTPSSSTSTASETVTTSATSTPASPSSSARKPPPTATTEPATSASPG